MTRNSESELSRIIDTSLLLKREIVDDIKGASPVIFVLFLVQDENHRVILVWFYCIVVRLERLWIGVGMRWLSSAFLLGELVRLNLLAVLAQLKLLHANIRASWFR